MITAERFTAFLMRQIVRISLALMIIGMILAAVKTDQTDSASLFFRTATALLLITPEVAAFCAGILFLLKKQFTMAFASFLLFLILGASAAFNIFN